MSECSTWERRKSQSTLTMLLKLGILRRYMQNAFILVLQFFMQNKIHRLPTLIFVFVSFSEITIFAMY